MLILIIGVQLISYYLDLLQSLKNNKGHKFRSDKPHLTCDCYASTFYHVSPLLSFMLPPTCQSFAHCAPIGIDLKCSRFCDL